MLVPTEKEALLGIAANDPQHIPGYGERGWCRCEYFIFSLAAEMRGRKVQLYAITRQVAPPPSRLPPGVPPPPPSGPHQRGQLNQ